MVIVFHRTNPYFRVTENMNLYNTIKACEDFRKFIDDLSTWYVRVNRDRFNEEDKLAPLVLKEVLEKLSELIAPIIPFVSEKIYQTVYSEKDSVHLTNWPKFDKKKISKKIIEDMEKAREIVSLGLAERDKKKVGLKWPLASATIYSSKKFNKEILEIISNQLNVKELILKDEEETKVEIYSQLTPELEAEGYAREISRQVQAFRKKLGLNKKDSIELIIVTNQDFKEILERQKEFIEERTNSKRLEILENVTTGKERFKNKSEFKIKDKKGDLFINF